MRVICETINAGMQPLQNLSTRFIHVVILNSFICFFTGAYLRGMKLIQFTQL